MSKTMRKLDLRGVTVATVLPFKNDSSIDWDGYARVLDYCACPDGIAAVFVNGHAGEGGSLLHDERQAVIERTRHKQSLATFLRLERLSSAVNRLRRVQEQLSKTLETNSRRLGVNRNSVERINRHGLTRGSRASLRMPASRWPSEFDQLPCSMPSAMRIIMQ